MNLLALIAAADPQQQANPIVSLLPLVLMGAVFYFMLIRPRKTQMRKQQELLAAIEAGDEVETFSGIFGTVARLVDDIAWIEIAPGTTVKVARSAIRRKVAVEDGEKAGS